MVVFKIDLDLKNLLIACFLYDEMGKPKSAVEFLRCFCGRKKVLVLIKQGE